MGPSLLNKSDCFILDLGKGHDILVYMPAGARRMEKFKATQAANEIRDEDHAGDANVEIIGKMKKTAFLNGWVVKTSHRLKRMRSVFWEFYSKVYRVGLWVSTSPLKIFGAGS